MNVTKLRSRQTAATHVDREATKGNSNCSGLAIATTKAIATAATTKKLQLRDTH
jgi:hypothetical protein